MFFGHTELSRSPTKSAAFSICVVIQQGLGGFTLSERHLSAPYLKDYDAIEGEGPTRWTQRFDLSRWAVILAQVEDSPVGGAVIAFDTPGVRMLEGRRDLAVLWDLRVWPS